MKERIVFVDYIRVVACLMVMMVHASENFYITGMNEQSVGLAMLANESNRFWVSLYDGWMGRVSVPLFMIISAFLLVPMKPGMGMWEFYRKRLKRILPPFICFLLLYSLLPLAWGGMSWEESLSSLRMLPFNFPPQAGHLWFMYPLISLYLIIPVVSPWLEKATAKEELTFIGIFAFTTLTPWLHRYVSPEVWGECFWNQYSLFWYCSGYLGYLVLAHYIRVHLKWTQRKRIVIGTICLIVGATFTAWSFWWKGVPGVEMTAPEMEWAWEFCTPNVLCATFGSFLLFTCIRQQKAPSVITSTAKRTYGMYLMHIFFLVPISQLFIQGNVASPIVPVWLAIPLIAILIFLCCAVTTKVLSYLPGSKYVIG